MKCHFNEVYSSELAFHSISRNMGDKVGRAIKYLFNQRSFYPLNPPSDKISLDSGLTQEFASLMTVPNFLILPSTLRCFIRVSV